MHGAISAIGDQKSWLNGWIYDNFKLREDNKQIDYIYDFETGKTQKTLFYKDIRDGKRKPRLENTHVIEYEVVGNTFFSPNLNVIHEWIKEKKVSTEDMASLGSFSVYDNDTDPIITKFGITFLM